MNTYWIIIVLIGLVLGFIIYRPLFNIVDKTIRFMDGLAGRNFEKYDNPSICPTCDGKNYHHTIACYLGLAEEK
jgi:hypothetical protein